MSQITIQKSTSGAYFTVLDSADGILRPFGVNDYDFIPDPDGVSFSLEARNCKSPDRFKIIDKVPYTKVVNGDTSAVFADFATLRTYVLTNFFRNAGGSTGAATWGAITGTLSAQTDLQAALDGKLSLSGGALTGRVYSSYVPTILTDVARLGDLELIDTVLTGCVTTASGTTATTTAGTWRIGNLIYSKGTSTSTTIPAQDATLSRYVCIYGTTSNTILGVNGTLSTDPVQPDIPVNTVLIDVILITATTVTVVSGGGKKGTGTVTQVIGINTNGFNWSIANSTTVPAITLRLQNATTSQSGQLTSTDWNTFNNKLDFYATDGTLSANRTVTQANKNLIFNGLTGGTFTVNTILSGRYSSISSGGLLSAFTAGNGLAADTAGVTLADLPAVAYLRYKKFSTGAFAQISVSSANGLYIEDQVYSRGATYAADYSANYTSRSLVDKAYVDAHSGGSTGVNGLNGTTSIGLGGALTGNTSIDYSTYSFSSFGDDTVSNSGIQSNASFLSFYAQTNTGGKIAELDITSNTDTYASLYYYDGTSFEKRILVGTTASGIEIKDEVDTVGAIYHADYSAVGSLNPRWIPDKGYTAATYSPIAGSSSITTLGTISAGSIPYSLVTGGPTASNGLTLTSGVFKLGGTLTAATTIDLSSTFHYLLQFTNGDIKVNSLTVGRGANRDASNTAFGSSALAANTTSGSGANTAIGSSTLAANTSGQFNTGVGYQTLPTNTTGASNTAIGASALNSINGSDSNTIIGANAFQLYTSGSRNTAIGASTGGSNTSGSDNVFIGFNAGSTLSNPSDKFVVGNNTNAALITGDFSNGNIGINNAVDDTVTKLQVGGNIKGLSGTSTKSYMVGGKIKEYFTDAGNTTTTETDLYSYTTEANILSDNGATIQAEYGGTFVSSATATREIKVYFGGTVLLDTGALTLTLSSQWTVYVTIIRVSSTVVRYMASLTTEGAALAAYTSSGEITGLTLSSTNILKVTGQAASTGAATNDIVAKLGSVYYWPVSI